MPTYVGMTGSGFDATIDGVPAGHPLPAPRPP